VKNNNVELIIDDDLTYKDDFIEMQIQTAKKFGLVEKKGAHDQIFSVFQKRLKLFMLLLDSKPIAGALCYYTPTTAYLAQAPYRPAAEDYLTNTLPLCASIRYACDVGYQYYEMGITPTETLAFHKEKFGGRRIPLMMYQKEFSYFKVISNKVFSRMAGFFKNYVRK
jgi:lipid II:glycine glycyltransferase (peptidoglycan interpeptide bridge formation enzyme)